MMRRRFTILLAVMMLADRAAAAPNVVERAAEKLRYDNCLNLAGLNPTAALGAATKWIAEQGGGPAEHCAAVALVGLKRYAEAARRLDALGRAPGMGELRPAIFDQAGNAWLLAGEGPQALASFQAALALSANDPDLYADLARAQALTKDWKGVQADMNAALALAPRRADLLVLRASARHALGDVAAARADLATALAIKPNYPEALVERGSIALDSGDIAAARADFENAIRQGAAGETADGARRGLAALDAAAANKAKPKAKPAIPPRR